MYAMSFPIVKIFHQYFFKYILGHYLLMKNPNNHINIGQKSLGNSKII